MFKNSKTRKRAGKPEIFFHTMSLAIVPVAAEGALALGPELAGAITAGVGEIVQGAAHVYQIFQGAANAYDYAGGVLQTISTAGDKIQTAAQGAAKKYIKAAYPQRKSNKPLTKGYIAKLEDRIRNRLQPEGSKKSKVPGKYKRDKKIKFRLGPKNGKGKVFTLWQSKKIQEVLCA